MYKINAYESFEIMPGKQFLDEVEIDVDFPFSSVVFNKDKFEIACEAVALKFLGGFNDQDFRIIFLNSVKLENFELCIWDDIIILENFVKKYSKIIKEKNNKFIIKLGNDDQLTYIKQLKLELLSLHT